MTFKELEDFFNENYFVRKLLFFKKLTCMPWKQKFEKSHESKYQKIYRNTYSGN